MPKPSATSRKIALRCYVRAVSTTRHIAVCVTLNLVAQGGTQREAMRELHGLIKAYISDAVKSNEIDAFVPRHAPLRYYAEYVGCLSATSVRALTTRFCAFTDHHPIPAHA